MLLGALLLGLASIGLSTATAADSADARIILAPLIKQYQDLIYAEKWDELTSLYHPNAVLVPMGDAAFLGPKNIFDEIKRLRAPVKDVKTEILTETYSGGGDVILYDNTWKIVLPTTVLTGPYRAVWIKYNGNFVVYHEEFTEQKFRRF